MAELNQCAPILELGFALNAVTSALHYIYLDVHRTIAREIYNDLRKTNAALPDDITHRAMFERWLLVASPGLRVAFRLHRVLGAIGLAVLGLSFYGLIQSAIDPTRPIAERWVWTYGMVALVLLPGSYGLFRRYITWLERAMILRRADGPEEETVTIKSFQAFTDLEALRGRTGQSLFAAEIVLMEMTLSRLGRRLARLAEIVWFNRPWGRPKANPDATDGNPP